MNPHEQDRWADAVHALRPDWTRDQLRTFAAAHLTSHPYRDAVLAAAYVATDANYRGPEVLNTPGPWWGLAGRLDSAPGILTYCEHHRPGLSCRDCYPRNGRGVTRTPAQLAAIRAGAAQGRAHLARLRAINEPPAPTR